ncbi:hypothetical protein E2562_009512 [Oryza meyeriana var. granulata]|uniref:Uncharacterized protein n=1 Tax=Oryza meyeriana var. granulata TaxID=110450 RepID=A0A6G1BTY9_9ORYZ|nr:hypothetical protein E2562_009512 [Oryza meyeriana var. granulata]
MDTLIASHTHHGTLPHAPERPLLWPHPGWCATRVGRGYSHVLRRAMSMPYPEQRCRCMPPGDACTHRRPSLACQLAPLCPTTPTMAAP